MPGGIEVVGPERFKIGKYHLRVRPVPDPDRLDRECSPEDEAGVRERVAAYFPEANGPTRRMVACMFTTSPDEHFILDRHPAMDDAFIAAGFSCHGYKFCGVIGRIMADLRLGEREVGVEGFGGGEVVRCRRMDVRKHPTSHPPRGLARISRVERHPTRRVATFIGLRRPVSGDLQCASGALARAA